MKLARWDPLSDIEEMQKALWGDSFWGSHVTSLATDVYTEGDDTLVVEAHLPGFSKDEIDIDINEGVLQIRAERSEKEEDKKKRKYMMRETSTSFYRRIRLPKHADETKIKADLEDGLLKVAVPFKQLPKPKKVAIKAKNSK